MTKNDLTSEKELQDAFDLKIFNEVIKCETYEQLAKVIGKLTNVRGEMQGTDKVLDGRSAKEACLDFVNQPPNSLTRMYGIRQQALYIRYYEQADQMTADLQKALMLSMLEKTGLKIKYYQGKPLISEENDDTDNTDVN